MSFSLLNTDVLGWVFFVCFLFGWLIFLQFKAPQLLYSIWISKFTSLWGHPGSGVPVTSAKVDTRGKNKATSYNLMFDI